MSTNNLILKNTGTKLSFIMGDKISNSSSMRKKSTLSPCSFKPRNRRPKHSDDPDSVSDDSNSQITLPEKRLKRTRDRCSHHSRSNTIRRRRVSCGRGGATDDCSSEDEDDDRRHKSKRSRHIGKEEIDEYVTKRALKKALKVADKLKSQNISNDANHFGDVNLNEKFVWQKKIERDVINHGVALNAYSVKAEKKRQGERMAEIEKLKKTREERAIEKARHEEDMALLARERARAAEIQDWEKKEEKFHFDQCKLGSEIRLREGRRIKPIDVLYKQLKDPDEFNSDIHEPCMVFTGLTVKAMEDLRDEIKMHLELDRESPTHVEYWEALLVVADWELAGARNKDTVKDRGVQSSIATEAEKIIQEKSCLELEQYQLGIESMMRSGTAYVVEFWEAILNRLRMYKAKARLREMLEQHLQNEDQPSKLEEDEDAGSFSPELLHGDGIEEAINPEEDRSILERKRKAVQQRRVQEAMGAIEDGEEIFGSGAQVNVDPQVYWWHDKYQPRKPKYFNRVHTGYEWNKYNQTHYDHDNPPKMVQGYKFNIFYTDLVDKTKAPAFTVEKDGESAETCIIRFHAGPPYEDIAFRVVNKEWEYSPKKGFKNTFERGILHVYFNFKRLRYRRRFAEAAQQEDASIYQSETESDIFYVEQPK